MNNGLKVYLLRHGETVMNADGNRYSGRTDTALTNRGTEQAETVGKLLAGKGIKALFASPLQRSRVTAELLGLPLPVQIDERLIEIDFGSWEGKTRAEFIMENPESWKNWNKDPERFPAGGDGEDATSVIRRMESFFREKTEIYRGESIAVVGHNSINRIYLAYCLGMPIRHYRNILQENSRVSRFEITTDGDFQLQRLNCGGE